jgi:two-component system nitrogen regulation sensor histidine kinase NtrY
VPAPPERRFSLAGKLTLLILAQGLGVAVVAAAAAWLRPWPWLVLTSGAAAAVLLAMAFSERVLGSARRTFEALTDGIRSFRDGDFSLRLAVTRRDELGDLVGLYNEMGDALREERHDIYQRELLLDTVLQGAPMGIVLAGPTGRVAYANRAARQLLAGGRRLEGQSFESVLAACPVEIRDTLSQPGDALFTVPVEGEEETYRVARRAFQINMQSHVLYVVERLTPELRRQEVEVWKKAIRIMNHELNNSLAPIRSLVHSARHVIGHPEHEHRLEGIFETLEERATYLSEFLEGYARFARLPRPQKRPVAWADFLEGVRRMTPFRLEGRPPDEPGHFDPAQMQQVLLNLLKNAYEAESPADEVMVSVRRAVDGTDAIRVLDRGRGMDDEVMKRALLPFYSSKPAGTGSACPCARRSSKVTAGACACRPAPAAGSSSPAPCRRRYANGGGGARSLHQAGDRHRPVQGPARGRAAEATAPGPGLDETEGGPGQPAAEAPCLADPLARHHRRAATRRPDRGLVHRAGPPGPQERAPPRRGQPQCRSQARRRYPETLTGARGCDAAPPWLTEGRPGARPSSDPVLQALHSRLFRAVRAAVEGPVLLHAVADDPALAVGARRGERVDRAFERVEGAGLAIPGGDGEGLVVVVAADGAHCH